MSEAAPTVNASESAELVALRAALRVRAGKDEAAEKAAARDALVASAVTKLAGWPVDDSLRADLVKLAETGAPAIDAFVETYTRHTPKDPPRTVEVALAQTAALAASDPKEITEALVKLGADTPEMRERARALVPQHAVLASTGYSIPLARFLELRLSTN